MNRLSVFLASIVLGAASIALAGGSLSASQSPRDEARRDEEAESYFRKWLNEDVVYIITREEKAVFSNLNTDEERERFIEQFWFRRDPDPRTSINEFKEEHYRRLAYANERFESGEPGWKTDRGRIYIIHGQPDQIEPHPSGGPYDRPLWEGGGTTMAFPFEVWRYRNLEGIGQDITIEFVDPSYSGEYRLARSPDDKDAFYTVPTLGLTMDEAEGFASRVQRGTPEDMRYYLRRDQPFDRYRQYVLVQRPPSIRFKDLQEVVQVNVSYDQLPVRVQFDQFRLGNDRVIVPLTIELDNEDLTLVENDGRFTADVAVYGLITNLTGQIVHEFEDEVVNTFSPEEVKARQSSRSLYQKTLVLETRSRYKVDLVVKDLNGSKLSVLRQAIVPQAVDEGKLAASSVLLSDSVTRLQEVPDKDEMFVLGDLKIRPNLARSFPARVPVSVYFQVYNASFDQASGMPRLEVRWELSRDGSSLGVVDERSNESVFFFSDSRVILLRSFPTDDLGPGRYTIQIVVRDPLKDTELQLSQDFQVG
jgi:GWxTD domain-containing protein